jgi:flagellar motility protein MotE (MotC chaperone)
MLGLNPDQWGALGTAAGGVGTLVAIVYGRIAAADKRAHELEMEAIKDSIEDQREYFQKEVDRIDTSLRKAWEHVDDLRINAVRRADQDRLRDEFRADIKTLGDRLVAELTALRNDIHRDKTGGE